MASDDMEVIIYKILQYLYSSIKVGKKACIEDVAWKCKLFDITREYWLAIMREIISDGYVSGLKYIEAKDMEGIIEIGDFKITRKGREYLCENSRMNHVKEFLGDSFKIVLGGVIGRL